MEEADELFSRTGFFRRIIPAIILHSAFLVGIALFTLTRISASSDPTVVSVLLVGFVVSVDVIRYRIAATKHRDLKLLFDQQYCALVEAGKIPLDPHSVMMLGAPGTFARRFSELS